MRRMVNRIGGVMLAAALLAGCQTAPKPFADVQLDQAEASLKTGNFQAAHPVLSMYLGYATDVGLRARSAIAGSAGYKAAMPGLFEKEIGSATHFAALHRVADHINDAKVKGVLPADRADALMAAADQRAIEGVRAGEIKMDLTDDPRYFPSLQTADAKKILFDRSLAALVQGSEAPRLVATTFEAAKVAGPDSYEAATLRKSLPQIKLSRSAVTTYVEPMFPKEARDTLAARTVRVRLLVEPEDRLLLEDLAEKVRRLSENITLVTSADADATVRVKRLQWEERRAPPATQTVMYAQHQVNLLGAVLLMPKNASYVYEVTKAGVDVAYAFEIKAEGAKIAPFDHLLRERESHSWTKCSNARIQNVFGGVQPATFVANDHQVGMCSGSSTEVSSDRIRSDALDKVVAGIRKVPPIEQAADLR